MVLATEIILPPRRNSFNGPDLASKSPPKSHWWFLTSKLKPAKTYGNIHTVATQKLRESKWFEQDEERLFCAVIESGFIVEVMLKEQKSEESKSHYGIVSVEAKKNKKPTASDIFVFTVNKVENRLKVIKLSVAELWSQSYKIRINNINDKHKKANEEKEIRNQITYAMKHKTLFHNSLHFVDFCRYGEQVELRKRQVSESVKWGTVGMNAGIFLMQREKSHSFSK